jgi:hypothetical protein
MKFYEVELRRESYITIVVAAYSKEEAEEKAWQEIEHNRADINDANWDIESIEETERTEEDRAE